MHLETRTLRKTINKAYLKETVDRSSFNSFKGELAKLLNGIENAREQGEREEHFKNLLSPFLNEVGFEDYYINTSGSIDLAIHMGDKVKDPVGVLMEMKRPSNKAEMITEESINRKAMHEAVLYYLEQRIDHDNSDLKHIIVSDLQNWFVFDAQEFERCFYRPSTLKKTYKSWKEDQKVSGNKDFMYGQIADFISEQDSTLRGLHVELPAYEKYLDAKVESDPEKKLIPLFKFFTPIHLLKEPFANDSNTLNREFYRELLYILGLEEVEEKNTRFIRRASGENRMSGSLMENSIRILDAEDHVSHLNGSSDYGSDRVDRLFNVALELSITWMNRILFLKLLEAQLYRYHRQDKKFKFLDYRTIDEFDELNKLFFQVLARRPDDRTEDVNEKFGHIPYLNSSLFDPTWLEHRTIRISNLDDKSTIPVYNRSVLEEKRGEEINTLQYLFGFLDAYDFTAERGEEIKKERKTLINASVLGLIFEKINGYKDGSFFTPGFITEYMARETLRKAVTDKFEDHLDEEDLSFTDIYNSIGNKQEDIRKANEIVDSIKICDPAVGSGHFLVSCLNELLAIKSDLGILRDTDGKLFRHVNVQIENDDLIVSWVDEELFEYDVNHTWQGNKLTQRKIAPERQRIQKALFHEKRRIIENCLFGVDINPNSVKICRLRLWIELLKNAYYTERSDYQELEVFPNIDINIKTGNSLVSRFDLDSDLSDVFKDSDHSLEDYKEAVRSYKETGDREEKQQLQELIDDIKEEYTTILYNNRPINKKLSKARGRLELMQDPDLFGEKQFTKKEIKKQEKKVKKLEKQKEEEESGVFYNQAFEWRFEFPEVLDEEGGFRGFDVVIGNPPYIRQEQLKDLKDYFKKYYSVYHGSADIYAYFIEKGMQTLKEGGEFHYIVSNKWLKTNYGRALRSLIQQYQIDSLIDFGDLQIFEEATTYPCLIQLRKTAPVYNFDAVEVESLKEKDLKFVFKRDGFKVDQNLFEKTGWTIIRKEEQKLLDNLIQQGTQFKEIVGEEIYRGVLSGYDEAFVIEQDTKNRLINEHKRSSDIIKPYLRGKDVQRYESPNANKYLIFTRRGVEIDKYPAIKSYLQRFKKRLKPKPKNYEGSEWPGRKSGSYKWYEIQDAVEYYEKFEEPKILYQKFQVYPQFTLDYNGHYCNSSTWFISADNKQLLVI